MFIHIVFIILCITSFLAGETKFGDLNHDGLVDTLELAAVGSWRTFYFILLSSHIFLAAIIMPFILYTAYRALTLQNEKHKKLAKITWPLWLFVSVSGVLIFWMIAPYYN